MARIVLGIGTSHTPMLAIESRLWMERAKADYANPALTPSDGRRITYEQLLQEVGPKYEAVITPEILQSKARECAACIERLADELQAARPDVVVIIGDDQRELFDENNQPLLAIYHGDEVVMSSDMGREGLPEWMQQAGKDYLMDQAHRFPAAPAFAQEVIGSLIERDVDVAAVAGVADPQKAGVGHAFGFIVRRLFRGRKIPVLPVLLNTYYPPNVPSARRAWRIGQQLARAIEDSPSQARVAVIASGGLSHFVVDENLDRGILKAFKDKDADHLCAIPRGALNSGSSEILNWILAAGAVGDMPLKWSEYRPLYRTAAGTGTGAGFAVWTSER